MKRVTFVWNDAAIEHLLEVLEEHYPSGFDAMSQAVREARPLAEDRP